MRSIEKMAVAKLVFVKFGDSPKATLASPLCWPWPPLPCGVCVIPIALTCQVPLTRVFRLQRQEQAQRRTAYLGSVPNAVTRYLPHRVTLLLGFSSGLADRRLISNPTRFAYFSSVLTCFKHFILELVLYVFREVCLRLSLVWLTRFITRIRTWLLRHM